MLKIYQIGERLWQYEEGKQPPAAVEVKPANKKGQAKTKTAAEEAGKK